MIICPGCNRKVAGSKCPVCSPSRLHGVLSLKICMGEPGESDPCEIWGPCSRGFGCTSVDVCKSRLARHLNQGGGCLHPTKPRFDRLGVEDITATTSPPINVESVALITTHYNPQQYARLRETYYEWLPSLGTMADRLTCIELVMDNDQPEIDGSTVIRGTRAKHTLWQKEALLNVALRSLPDSVRYVAWLDHDIVIRDREWLTKSIAMIDSGNVAVQLFSKMLFLNADRTVHSEKVGSVKHGTGCPGGAWIADRQYLDAIGGLWDWLQ